MLSSPDHSESVGTIFGKIIYLSIFFKKSHLSEKTHLGIIYLSIAYFPLGASPPFLSSLAERLFSIVFSFPPRSKMPGFFQQGTFETRRYYYYYGIASTRLDRYIHIGSTKLYFTHDTEPMCTDCYFWRESREFNYEWQNDGHPDLRCQDCRLAKRVRFIRVPRLLYPYLHRDEKWDQ